jgi:hypothetical protein
MQQNKRQHYRIPVNFEVVFYWEDAAGQVYSTRPRARDASDFGMNVESSVPIESGTEVCVDAAPYASAVSALVRHCTQTEGGYRIGIQFSSRLERSPNGVHAGMDCYEILQLSPKADLETIHRVYRIMAARFHPDNPEGGDAERFLLLSEAYKVLSDPERRAQYDRMKSTERPGALPLFQARAFVDEKEGEMNRRLGVLCLLYAQRRRSPDHPTISLIELEGLMSIPREYLEFTLWYLKQKNYVEMNQGADFSLTAVGVDFAEEHTVARDMLLRLLTTGDPQVMRESGGQTGYASSQVN